MEGKDYSFPKQEQLTLKFWEDTDAFHEQLRRSEGRTPYIFFDGVSRLTLKTDSEADLRS